MNRPNHNPNAKPPRSLDYPSVRAKHVRLFIELDHEYPDVPPIHIPVTLDGVVP